jgi:shikimate dehydrogenase
MDSAPPIDARTQLTAVFGDPIEHSLSPAMHNAAYAALGMDRAYVAFHVRREYLREALHAIRSLGMLGVNLTVPHKEHALRMMAHLTDEARLLGAVNCVINRDGVLYGDNSDARGLDSALDELGIAIENRLSIIIGAGGAAAAAVIVCMRRGAGRILICNRTVARAKRLARRFGENHQRLQAQRCGIEACSLDALVDPAILSTAALVINATPMGLKTDAFAALDYGATPTECVFYDLIYAREPTPFLSPATAIGRRAVDGAEMLLNQGAIAFGLFNGVTPPKEAMRDALLRALGRE